MAAQQPDAPPGERVARRTGGAGAARWLALPATAFLVGLVIPWVIQFGPMRLSVYRIVLLVMVLPCLVLVARGRAGRISVADVAVFLYCLWLTTTLSVLHGAAALQPAGIAFIETAGAYFLGRCFVRSLADFEALARTLFVITVAVLPFALIEAATGTKAILDLFGLVLPTYHADPMEPRFGLWRVQGPFDHAILFGVVFGMPLAMMILVLGRDGSVIMRYGRAAIVGLTAALCVSAGPFSAIAIQCALVGYDRVLRSVRSRWLFLIAAVGLVYVLLDVLARRPAIEIMISAISFDPTSYWTRLLIWTYAAQSYLAHPLFGTGLDDWNRPSGIYFSIDNLWLLQAVRFGTPGLVLMLLIVFASILPVAFRKFSNARLADARTAFVIMMTSCILASITVHFWDAAYALFLFMLGSGRFLRTVDEPQLAESSPRPARLGHRPLILQRPDEPRGSKADVRRRERKAPAGI